MIALSQNLRMLVGKSLLLIPRTSELFWTSSEIIGCLLKNILRSSTKNWGTCRASHEDENLDKLTPLWYQNVKVKRSVFALRMMSDELSSWKVALYARYRQAQSALQRLLDERAQLQQHLIDTKRQVTSLIGFYWYKSYGTYIVASASSLSSLTPSSSSSSSSPW